jgi:hypothetical protein
MDFKFAPAGILPEAPERIARRAAKRRVQLERATDLFSPGVKYTEREINDLLKTLFVDHVFARRMMVEHRILDRTATGSEYWKL